MRFAIPVLSALLLALSGHALEKADVVGFWKGTFEEDPGMKMECWFDANGTMETRGGGTAMGIFEVESSSKGVWKVESNDLWVKITSGWMSFDGEPAEPEDPDMDYEASNAQLIPGNPKSLKMTDDSDGESVTFVMKYQGTSKAYTLKEVGPGSAVRRIAGATAKRSPSGWVRFRAFRNGQAFDLRGRTMPQIR
jgi:hypothetical protein